jgi:hypothetical protein
MDRKFASLPWCYHLPSFSRLPRSSYGPLGAHAHRARSFPCFPFPEIDVLSSAAAPERSFLRSRPCCSLGKGG